MKIFCDVVENNSFTKAAFLNFVTQSAVSQRMRSLENEFGVALIERIKAGDIKLTPSGRLFYKTAKEILKNYQILKDELRAPAQGVSGELSIATIYSVGLHELPPYIKRFMKRYPQVKLHIEYSRSNQIYEMVSEGVVDLGIVAYPVKRAQTKIIPFKNDKLLLITPPGHAFSKQNTVDIRKLDGYNFVAFEKDIPTRKAIDKILKTYKTSVNNAIEFDNIETIKRAVEIGIGVSIVPSATITQEIKTHTLHAVNFSNRTFLRPIGIIYKHKRRRSLAEIKFIESLTSHL